MTGKRQERSKAIDDLVCALAGRRTPDEVYAFLEDLCTKREIIEMAQRLDVARMLSQGISYIEIQQKTGASATTISRVSKCLNYGTGGYAAVLDLENM